MKLIWKDKDKFLKKSKKISSGFLKDLKIAWSEIGNSLVSGVVKTQLSGRPGLERVTGNAARALNVNTKIKSNNVVQKFYLQSSNPAKIYLPMHDKRRKGSGYITSKNSSHLHFKTKSGDWVKTDKVYIPVRTDIYGYIDEKGKKKWPSAVKKVMDKYLTKI